MSKCQKLFWKGLSWVSRVVLCPDNDDIGRGGHLFSQGGGKDSSPSPKGRSPRKNFAFPPPRFLGGKGFQTLFWEKLIPQEPNS